MSELDDLIFREMGNPTSKPASVETGLRRQFELLKRGASFGVFGSQIPPQSIGEHITEFVGSIPTTLGVSAALSPVVGMGTKAAGLGARLSPAALKTTNEILGAGAFGTAVGGGVALAEGKSLGESATEALEGGLLTAGTQAGIMGGSRLIKKLMIRDEAKRISEIVKPTEVKPKAIESDESLLDIGFEELTGRKFAPTVTDVIKQTEEKLSHEAGEKSREARKLGQVHFERFRQEVGAEKTAQRRPFDPLERAPSLAYVPSQEAKRILAEQGVGEYYLTSEGLTLLPGEARQVGMPKHVFSATLDTEANVPRLTPVSKDVETAVKIAQTKPGVPAQGELVETITTSDPKVAKTIAERNQVKAENVAKMDEAAAKQVANSQVAKLSDQLSMKLSPQAKRLLDSGNLKVTPAELIEFTRNLDKKLNAKQKKAAVVEFLKRRCIP